MGICRLSRCDSRGPRCAVQFQAYLISVSVSKKVLTGSTYIAKTFATISSADLRMLSVSPWQALLSRRLEARMNIDLEAGEGADAGVVK